MQSVRARTTASASKAAVSEPAEDAKSRRSALTISLLAVLFVGVLPLVMLQRGLGSGQAPGDMLPMSSFIGGAKPTPGFMAPSPSRAATNDDPGNREDDAEADELAALEEADAKKDEMAALEAAAGYSGGTNGGGVDSADEDFLAAKVHELGEGVRTLRAEGKIATGDRSAVDMVERFQDMTRALLRARYGSVEPYRVELTLRFPETAPDFTELGGAGRLIVELASSNLMPHAVFTFLEIVREWRGGMFHRVAGHVLQAVVLGQEDGGLRFQEYSDQYPHVSGTLGFAGRPGGPAFYISIVDNTRNHGPGSQGSATEADSCFGRIVEGEDVVQRMKRQSGARDANGFMSNPHDHVQITAAHILPGPESE